MPASVANESSQSKMASLINSSASLTPTLQNNHFLQAHPISISPLDHFPPFADSQLGMQFHQMRLNNPDGQLNDPPLGAFGPISRPLGFSSSTGSHSQSPTNSGVESLDWLSTLSTVSTDTQPAKMLPLNSLNHLTPAANPSTGQMGNLSNLPPLNGLNLNSLALSMVVTSALDTLSKLSPTALQSLQSIQSSLQSSLTNIDATAINAALALLSNMPQTSTTASTGTHRSSGSGGGGRREDSEDADEGASGTGDDPNKKSLNVTDKVIVPSSEHVAEIVGRQGFIPTLYIFIVAAFILFIGYHSPTTKSKPPKQIPHSNFAIHGFILIYK